MATIVNDGLSPALYAAIKNVREGYSRTGYLSTTSCIDSPRIRVLEKRHDSEIVINASTLLPTFFGSCVHSEIERGAHFLGEEYAAEKEFVIDVAGIRFSGRPDLFDIKNKKVGDYKTTSVWTYQFNPGGKTEHIAQININAKLIRAYGYEVNSGWIELIFLDWKQSSAKREQNYPRRVETVEVPSLWTDEQVTGYIENRVKLHLLADEQTDNNLPICTAEEKWQKSHVYSVMKKGQKRAVRNLDSMDEAKKLAAELGRSAYIDERPGERTRCENYCNVKQWCNQYAEESAGGYA